MENEIKVGDWIRTKDGFIDKIVDIRDTYSERKLIAFEKSNSLKSDIGLKAMAVKHSPNLIDIIEDNDFCKIEFYSPRYKKRGTRIFEVSKIDEYITFENMHCDLFMKNGEWGNHDKELNPVIKEIYTKEMMESISYKVERKD